MIGLAVIVAPCKGWSSEYQLATVEYLSFIESWIPSRADWQPGCLTVSPGRLADGRYRTQIVVFPNQDMVRAVGKSDREWLAIRLGWEIEGGRLRAIHDLDSNGESASFSAKPVHDHPVWDGGNRSWPEFPYIPKRIFQPLSEAWDGRAQSPEYAVATALCGQAAKERHGDVVIQRVNKVLVLPLLDNDDVLILHRFLTPGITLHDLNYLQDGLKKFVQLQTSFAGAEFIGAEAGRLHRELYQGFVRAMDRAHFRTSVQTIQPSPLPSLSGIVPNNKLSGSAQIMPASKPLPPHKDQEETLASLDAPSFVWRLTEIVAEVLASILSVVTILIFQLKTSRNLRQAWTWLHDRFATLVTKHRNLTDYLPRLSPTEVLPRPTSLPLIVHRPLSSDIIEVEAQPETDDAPRIEVRSLPVVPHITSRTQLGASSPGVPTGQPNPVCTSSGRWHNMLDRLELSNLSELYNNESLNDFETFDSILLKIIKIYLGQDTQLPLLITLKHRIENVTEGKLSLILPDLQSKPNSELHDIVGRIPVSKGRIGAIVGIRRPGLLAQEKILCKAEVIIST
ncbi:MAG: hypothetical protein WCF85_17875 [Rhodospirillaceae bacterium]